MKLLAFYASRFCFQVPGESRQTEVQDAVIAWIQVETHDAERRGRVVTRLVKSLKWMARKNATRRIHLHSFAHLSESRGSADTAREVIASAEHRLTASGYLAQQTPFGHTVDMLLETPGASTTRRFESI